MPPSSSPPSASRLLAPGQPVDVWLELDVPRGSGQGVAQVVAQLSSLDGRVAAKASRAVLLRTDWWSMGCVLRRCLCGGACVAVVWCVCMPNGCAVGAHVGGLVAEVCTAHPLAYPLRSSPTHPPTRCTRVQVHGADAAAHAGVGGRPAPRAGAAILWLP